MEAISQCFDAWCDAVATENPDTVVALYLPDATLLPTLSNQVRHNHPEIRDYFVHFLAKGPRCTLVEANIVSCGEDYGTNSGVYAFDFRDGSRAVARFSYVYQRTAAGWSIVSHHSSVMPEG